jgi:UDP-N-acetyl-D-glucosamine dehydrogenase
MDMTHKEKLAGKIYDRTAMAGIVGLGYVGLPLAMEFGRAGFEVVGFDIQTEKISLLNQGKSYIQDVPEEVIEPLVAHGRFRATDDFSKLAEMDTINICVPTPLRKTKDPDMSFIVNSTEQIAKYLRPGTLVILESTTYPGTTDELVLPILEKSGLKVGEDFFVCFSPERVDPGNAKYQTRNIPKVVGGITPACTELGALFYAQSLDTVIPVTSTSVAEMVKLLENTFRMINIGLVNEMAMMCDRMGINVWEVIDAAATKPFGFMPFYPGPGLGGHCIPVDPFYLAWKTRQQGIEARFIDLAGYINGQMPHFVVDKVQHALNESRKPLRDSKIHVLGVAYKKNIEDVRESPALDIIHVLKQRGAVLSYSDPFVPHLRIDGLEMDSQDVLASCQAADCVVLITDHSAFDREAILAASPIVVDTRNAFKGMASEKLFRL